MPIVLPLPGLPLHIALVQAPLPVMKPVHRLPAFERGERGGVLVITHGASRLRPLLPPAAAAGAGAKACMHA